MRKKLLIWIVTLLVLIPTVNVNVYAYTIYQYYDNYVYIASSDKGKCWHTDENCSNMKDACEITLREAIDSGYKKCSKCRNDIYQQIPIGEHNENTVTDSKSVSQESLLDKAGKVFGTIAYTLAAIMELIFMLCIVWGLIVDPIIKSVKEKREIKQRKIIQSDIAKKYQHQTQARKADVELVYCPECAKAYVKGEEPYMCKCGYIFSRPQIK